MSFDLNNDAALNAGYAPTAEQRNAVLRNTYALLGLSMIPTVLGAAIGVYSGLAAMLRMSPWIGLMVFFAGAFGLMYMVERNRDRAAGVAWLLGFTFFMGLMLSMTISRMLGYKNGGELIMLAFGGTALVFVGMASIASKVKRDLSGMAKFLTIGLFVLIGAMIANIFFQIPALTLTIAAGCVLVFSAFLVYDLNRIMTGGETNYISATLNVYLDVYNIFTSLLQILGITGGSRD